MQGDPISPLIFNVLTHDVGQRIQTDEVRMWLYADEMILLSERREPLQEAINKLQEWSQENDLIINRDKTKAMKFRKGGTLKNTDLWGTSTGNSKKITDTSELHSR